MATPSIAGLRCPHCGIGLALPHDGEFRCPGCRRVFDLRLSRYSPPGLAGPEAPVGSRCAAHEGNAAFRLCERCGDFLCALCVTPVERRVYCPSCFDLLHARGAFRFSHTGFTQPRAALTLAGMSWLAMFVPGLNLILAGLAIVQGLAAQKRLREKPDLPGRPQALAALALAGLNIAVTVAGGVWIAWILWRLA